jgi:hypothetical protein
VGYRKLGLASGVLVVLWRFGLRTMRGVCVVWAIGIYALCRHDTSESTMKVTYSF